MTGSGYLMLVHWDRQGGAGRSC